MWWEITGETMYYFSLHNWIKSYLNRLVRRKFLFISPLLLKHYYKQKNQINYLYRRIKILLSLQLCVSYFFTTNNTNENEYKIPKYSVNASTSCYSISNLSFQSISEI